MSKLRPLEHLDLVFPWEDVVSVVKEILEVPFRILQRLEIPVTLIPTIRRCVAENRFYDPNHFSISETSSQSSSGLRGLANGQVRFFPTGSITWANRFLGLPQLISVIVSKSAVTLWNT